MDIPQALECILANRAKSGELGWIADIFGRLIWIVDEPSQAAILRLRDAWLESSDREKVEVALEMRESYPAESREELITRLDAVAERFPEIRERCDRWVKAWDDQHPPAS